MFGIQLKCWKSHVFTRFFGFHPKGGCWECLGFLNQTIEPGLFFFFRGAFGAKIETTGQLWMDPEDVKMDPEDVNFLLNMRTVLVAIAS